MRIGLFGGTFNPVHFGHLKVSLEIKDMYDLDKIIVIPSAIPPHKKNLEMAEAAERLEMTELAFQNVLGFSVSDVELQRGGPSYTIDTIKSFIVDLSVKTKFFLVLGIDAFLEINTWKLFTELFDLISFIVMARPGKWSEPHAEKWKCFGDYLKTNISDDYIFLQAENKFVHQEKKTVYISDVDPVNISSTQIREFVRTGRSIQSLVPKKVEAFIINRGLYL